MRMSSFTLALPRLKPLTVQLEEALRVVDRLAFENGFSIEQQTGDLKFFNNIAVLHARSPFVDDDVRHQRSLTEFGCLSAA